MMLSTALITVSASLFGMLIGITFQKYMNDRDKKFSAYIEIIDAIAESTHADSRQNATRKFIAAKQKILVYGSEDVIRYLSVIPAFDATSKAQYDAYLELIIMMRKETSIIPYTKRLSKDVLRQILG